METCCCGCSLEKGSTVIAILGLIFGGTSFITSILAFEILKGADIFGNILAIVAAGLLLWGTLKNKTPPVLAYLILQALSLFSDVVVLVLLTVAGAVMAAGGEPAKVVVGSAFIAAAVVAAIFILISIYLWIVVYSFYRQLKEGGSASAPPIYKA